ncbi:proline racemase family protein [Paenarthrobacter aromaticivorans]|uniref:Proline racemase family protein n=1 Tax=Paenarthrobacter aromaticivorans TaxID=2849150 RepID=A0ABS6I5P0_9MICC|nr:proline racemase family protein [Paenarthrobacter sp. MMS21-TAE1-1]MBU8865747.1 proline racemase family protein [Paenarthrobacter sp. MMS21-TAE1-1]
MMQRSTSTGLSGKLVLDAIEVHAEGEPGRILTSAASLVKGGTMVERLQYCKENLDWLRRLMLHEPRGYPGLCSVILLPPVNEGSDFGIVVLEQGGFTPMSGSNTICAVTAVLEQGIVPVRGPETVVTIDTAVGVVTAVARVEGGKVLSVTVVNVPAFVVELDHPLQVPEYGTVPVDVVFGGQFFAQARVADLGLELHPDNGKELARAGALIKMAALEQIHPIHPENPAIAGVNLVMLHTGDRVAGRQDRNTVVLSNGKLVPSDPSTWTGALDRSPCGTGTSARMAALHARGQLAVGEDFSHHSIIGSEFIGRLTGTTTVGRREAVLPTITGRGWVTGTSQWVLDPTDPFPTGYTVGDIWAPGA